MKHEKRVSGAVFTWDGHRILSRSESGTARFWSATNSTLITQFPDSARVAIARFDPPEQRVLGAAAKNVLQLWDISFNPKIPLEERILEFEVRSATTLASNGS